MMENQPVPQQLKTLEPNEIRELLRGIIERKDEDALWMWIEAYIGVRIPRVAICHDHCAPFDFVRDFLFEQDPFIIVLANRSGGKTMDFGILDTICSFLYDGIEIATVGAIQEQAKKCYGYFEKYTGRYPFIDGVSRRTMERTTFRDGGVVQVLTGTVSGVNSPHPVYAFLDEIDLMPWQILQQAFSMAQSQNGVSSKTVLTSTRKFANGSMQRLMNESKERKAKVYTWCIWEVAEKIPEEMREEIYETFGAALPPDIDKCDGYYKWTDIITKYNQLDRETWETEWICKRPGLQGVIYGSSYSDDNNLLMGWTPEGKGGSIYIFEDFGFGEGHEDVPLFAWIPTEKDRIVIFDELYLTLAGTDDIWQEIKERIESYGFVMPDAATWTRGSIVGWIPDYHGLTEIQDREARGAPMFGKVDNPEIYLVQNGIKLVKKYFESGRLMITDRCVRLRLEILSYHLHKLPNGTYTQNPDKVDDNGVDSMRYGVIALNEIVGENAFRIKRPPLEKKDPIQKPLTKAPVDKPITAGMLNKRY